MNWKYNEDRKRIILDEPPKQRLRISGHRMSTVLGLNKYATPFQAWCEITKLLKAPFEENKYLIAGRTIEPKTIEYAKTIFPNVMSMEEYYGNAIDNYRYNNFKDDSNIFGGMFDAVSVGNDGQTISLILEMKTTSKPHLFANNEVPVEYLLQASLYARLKGLDRVVFVVNFLNDMDYARPENYVVTPENTKIIVKKLKECFFEINGEYYDIDGCMKLAEEWWHNYIDTGVSPEFDEKLDKEYLTMLREKNPSNDNDLTTLCLTGIELAKNIKLLEETSGINEMKKQLKVIEDSIKSVMVEKNLDVCDKYILKRTTKTVFDEKRFAKEHELTYNKYCEDKVTYTLSKNMKEDD